MYVRYSPAETDEPAVTIVTAISKFKGVPSTNLDPIVEAVDVDALSALFSESSKEFYRDASTEGPTVEVMFRHEGCEVTIFQDQVRIESVS